MNKDKLDQLREKFFKECTEEKWVWKIGLSPVDIFNWFVTNLQGEAMDEESIKAEINDELYSLSTEGGSRKLTLGQCELLADSIYDNVFKKHFAPGAINSDVKPVASHSCAASSLFGKMDAFCKDRFPDATAIDHLRKLKNEVEEAIAEPTDSEEWGDLQLCLFGAASKQGYSYTDLINFAAAKFDKVLSRKWEKQSDGTYQHIKESSPPASSGNDIEQDDFEDDFEPCSNCDLPDACSDFGCAIKRGVRKDYPIDGVS